MPIFRRVADMLSANLNDLIERFEDPESLLRQAVREMEAAVDQTMAAAARSIASERLLASQIEEHRQHSTVLHNRARDAVARHDDDGARSLLAERRRHDDLAAVLGDQLSEIQKQNSRLRRRLDGLRARLSEARQTMHLHIARNRAARAQREFAADAFQINTGSEAWQRFDRMRDRIDRADAESRAYLELTGEYAANDAVTEAGIDVELAALKEQLAAGT